MPYQGAYAQHYSMPPPQQPPARTTSQTTNSSSTPGASGSGNTGDMHTADVATLNDALGLSGVDLRAEEEAMHRTQEVSQSGARYAEDRSRKQSFLDPKILSQAMRGIGTAHNVQIPDEAVAYLALALRSRLQTLLTNMVSAASHRVDSSEFSTRPVASYTDGTPMWDIVVRRDVGKQLAALEKADKDEEVKAKRERNERAASLNNAGGTGGTGGGGGGAGGGGEYGGDDGDEDDGPKKKKKKKDGPGVTARNMSEDVRKKMSDIVAQQASGATKYAWMNAGSSGTSATPKPNLNKKASANTSTGSATTGTGSGWARAFVPTKPGAAGQKPVEEADKRKLITLKDAMFVVERERGHGGGRGSARGWT